MAKRGIIYDFIRLGDREDICLSKLSEYRELRTEESFEKELDMYNAMTSVRRNFKKREEGVYAIASTFMSLKVLVECLTSPEVDIPVSALGLGPVSTGDIRKASKLLERKPLFATVLAFQVEVTQDAAQLAHELGVKVICGDSIEHMCLQFKELGEEEEETKSDEAVFPCILRILPNCVLNKEDPIVVGVYVVEGLVKVGTPICIPRRAFIDIGRVAWIQKDQQPVEVARLGEQVIIKIVAANPKTQQVMLGREFHVGDGLVSRISRRSIKANDWGQLSSRDQDLVTTLNVIFSVL